MTAPDVELFHDKDAPTITIRVGREVRTLTMSEWGRLIVTPRPTERARYPNGIDDLPV